MSEDARRRAILDAAARLFRHYGHAKTTMAEIAREAHIGVGSVYLAFPSKEAIVEELSSSAHVRVLGAMREVAEARARDSFSERLAGVLEVRVRTFQSLAAEGQHACELVHCKSEPVQSARARFGEEERALLVELLEQARASAEIGRIDVRRAAVLVQRAYATLSPPWLFDEPAEEAQRVAYEMCRMLLLGLMSRGDSRDDVEPTKPKRARRRAR